MTDCTFSRLFFRDSSSRSGRVMYINSYFRNGSTSFWTQAAPLREQGVSISRLTTIDCIRDLEARQGLFPLLPWKLEAFMAERGAENIADRLFRSASCRRTGYRSYVRFYRILDVLSTRHEIL